ncbi:GNAT family N-acetyltransferase, partial [Streptomyces sp. T-3]|nr:GNAT family N-acetyltransferase [Streptomyces sp. T-3]
MQPTLSEILDAAARGKFPPMDGSTTVVPQPGARDAGVLACTAHSVVFMDEDPEWVRATLASVDCDALSATMNPRFLTALLDRTGRTIDTIDLLTVADRLPGAPPLALREIEDPDHPRVVRARHRRDGVRVWAADGGVLVLGRGV